MTLNIPSYCKYALSYQKGIKCNDFVLGNDKLTKYIFPRTESQIAIPSYLFFFYAGNWNQQTIVGKDGVEYYNYVVERSVPNVNNYRQINVLNMVPLSLEIIK